MMEDINFYIQELLKSNRVLIIPTYENIGDNLLSYIETEILFIKHLENYYKNKKFHSLINCSSFQYVSHFTELPLKNYETIYVRSYLYQSISVPFHDPLDVIQDQTLFLAGKIDRDQPRVLEVKNKTIPNTSACEYSHIICYIKNHLFIETPHYKVLFAKQGDQFIFKPWENYGS